MFHWTNYSNLTRLPIKIDTILFSNRQLISSLIHSTLWFVWHAHTHNSHTQNSRLISLITKLLSQTHRKCQSKPNIWILPPLLQKNKYGRSKLCRDQIFPHTIYLYNKKFGWLFIVDPIWLVWHTSLTHSLIHWPVHNIPDALTKRYFFLPKK